MSQPEELVDSHSVTEFILIEQLIHDNKVRTAIGTYKTKESAYAAALIRQMQSIEKCSDKWSKTKLGEKQAQIIELCRYIKTDLTSYEARYEYVTKQCTDLFEDISDVRYIVVPLKIDTNPPFNESVFKTKIRNFLDVFQTKSDIEEDLGNSDDDDDDDDEEDLEEDLEEEDLEEDLEEEDLEEEDIEEEDEEDLPTSEPPLADLDDISDDDIEEEEEDEEEEEEEEEEEGSSHLKRSFSALEEDEEEDEIDEDGEDELDDDDDTLLPNKRKRLVISED
ncbi:uncharacterized protein EV154DRAFT_519582 [Mucor mucedo]|uniref:uncharacterized protein n=1 Tax=Mucor mucedo TaxID=29922 RepID=UPI00221F7DC5|nr:uncharacterized protein EV154DRAFT_519582 [Mucor mucedo]KAI7887828.1 hypothetical protein EV154DRAFT_519582 [Mucor mucedo]